MSSQVRRLEELDRMLNEIDGFTSEAREGITLLQQRMDQTLAKDKKKQPLTKEGWTKLSSLEHKNAFWASNTKKPESEREVCCICLKQVTQPDLFSTKDLEILQLNKCKHVFHRACVEPWFKQACFCPMCRDLL
jgi:hypothetical protein